jgi:hypothetical protein
MQPSHPGGSALLRSVLSQSVDLLYDIADFVRFVFGAHSVLGDMDEGPRRTVSRAG